METSTKRISPEILFSAIKEQLAEGREVSFTVTGKSMWPFIINERDSVIIRSCDPEQVKTGDIILFQTPARNYKLHRITSLKNDQFEATGDGNLIRDGWFSRDCIIARVERIIRKGKVIRCDDYFWRFVFSAWMFLYPIRPFLACILITAGKIKTCLTRQKG